jgi:hypothetical protein
MQQKEQNCVQAFLENTIVEQECWITRNYPWMILVSRKSTVMVKRFPEFQLTL